MPDTAPSSNRNDHAIDELGRRIRAKRDDVDRYLADACRHRHRLAHVTIVAGSVAAALTAPPALGGKPVSDWLGKAFALGDAAPAWRLLCLAAMVCSLAATIATQLQKSNNYDTNIAQAQTVRAALEALDIGIASGHLTRREATLEYIECVEHTSFIHARAQDQRRGPRPTRRRA